MHVVVRPEPEPPERRALEAALVRLLDVRPGRHPAYESRWRRAALPFDGAVYAAARPRSSRGATRA